VVNISYYDAITFAKWANGRLPTELEWEKAARGVDGRKYPWGESWQDGQYCNSTEAGLNTTTPVDAYPNGVSPYGVWDLIGNVGEWTSSSKDSFQVICGGSFLDTILFLQTTFRRWIHPSFTYFYIGFRCVRDEAI
jgi:formylglycine-generating enzyme required for sulfatase activity